jgi:hypothetical protein
LILLSQHEDASRDMVDRIFKTIKPDIEDNESCKLDDEDIEFIKDLIKTKVLTTVT